MAKEARVKDSSFMKALEQRAEEEALNLSKKPKTTKQRAVVDLTGEDDAAASEIYTLQKKRSKKGSAPNKVVKPDGERRFKRHRAKKPQSFYTYWERAMTQRLIVLDRERTIDVDCPHGTPDCPMEEVDIAGSTGNVYKVTIKHVPTCTCPDFMKGNAQCKHIVNVLVKVLKAPEPISYQLAFLTDELRTIFENAGPLPVQTVDDSDKDGKRKTVEGDCPICCEEMHADGGEQIVWCKAACGNNMHADCMNQWVATKRGGPVSCPFCRTPWQNDASPVKDLAKSGAVGAEGYVNLGQQLGLSGTRDYSSYHPFWVRSQIRNGNIQDAEYDYDYDDDY